LRKLELGACAALASFVWPAFVFPEKLVNFNKKKKILVFFCQPKGSQKG
jgi:hypothetical protein